MKKKLHTLTIAFLSVLLVNAQTIQRRCASFEHLQQQLTRDPQMQERLQNIEKFTHAFVSQHQNTISLRGTPVYTIPVVVHVLWNTSAQNISDAQIQSQIDALNKDYQLLNADTGLVPSPFKSFVADCQIQFCLAKRDPGGAATTGVVRKQTSKTSFNADTDDSKSNSTGGDNAWNASKYLNLWVVPDITSGGQSGILGYAQFPGGPAATDGVVIGYKYFGTTGTVVAPFNKGRTATHEVGHWLNLRHIWGDEPNCAQDDLVGDTPLQADKNFGCPTFPRVDACSGGNGVMYMNYMDYTDDACMYLFTNGQKSRMYGVLAAGGARNSITTSDVCVPPTTTGCTAPSGLTASSITTTSAVLSWSAVSGANSYDLDYKPASSATWTNLATATTATSVSETGLTASTTYDWRVRANCASSSSAYTSAQFTTSTATSGCVSNYEPNETFSAAAAIGTNTALSAAIGSSTDKDWYKFTLSGNSNLNITLTNLPGDYDIILYNSAGTEIKRSENAGTTNETITNNNTAAGTYYLQVFGYNGANSTTICYGLNVGVSTSTSTCPGTYDVSTNGTTGGAAQIPLNTDIKGLISPAGDLDHYKFVITTGGTITLTLTTLPGDYDLRLYNSGGTQVAISQNGGTSSETINYTAAAGTYYARVYGYNNANSSTSCYTLKVMTGTAARVNNEFVQKESRPKVDVYPNPANKLLNIAVSDYEGKAIVRVSDINGRKVIQQSLVNMNSSIDIQKLAKGVYFIQVITNNGTVLSQTKFIRN